MVRNQTLVITAGLVLQCNRICRRTYDKSSAKITGCLFVEKTGAKIVSSCTALDSIWSRVGLWLGNRFTIISQIFYIGGQRKGVLTTLSLCGFATISACGTSDREMEYLLDEAYEQGYWDALACVRRKGGSASVAAYDCQDE